MIDYEALLQNFRGNSNAKFDEFNRKIINSSVPTIGCTVPYVRKVARSFGFADAAELPVNKFVEIDMLRGILISQAKLPFAEKSAYLHDFAQTLENWAVCDISAVKVPTEDSDEYFGFFRSFLLSDKPFVCRYGVVNLLSNYLCSDFIDRVFDALTQITLFGDYYVDMAVAWLVATAFVKCREQTKEYLEGDARHVLNAFTYNKALQKMRDSFRVSAEDKQWTRSLKM